MTSKNLNVPAESSVIISIIKLHNQICSTSGSVGFESSCFMLDTDEYAALFEVLCTERWNIFMKVTYASSFLRNNLQGRTNSFVDYNHRLTTCVLYPSESDHHRILRFLCMRNQFFPILVECRNDSDKLHQLSLIFAVLALRFSLKERQLLYIQLIIFMIVIQQLPKSDYDFSNFLNLFSISLLFEIQPVHMFFSVLLRRTMIHGIYSNPAHKCSTEILTICSALQCPFASRNANFFIQDFHSYLHMFPFELLTLVGIFRLRLKQECNTNIFESSAKFLLISLLQVSMENPDYFSLSPGLHLVSHHRGCLKGLFKFILQCLIAEKSPSRPSEICETLQSDFSAIFSAADHIVSELSLEPDLNGNQFKIHTASSQMLLQLLREVLNIFEKSRIFTAFDEMSKVCSELTSEFLCIVLPKSAPPLLMDRMLGFQDTQLTNSLKSRFPAPPLPSEREQIDKLETNAFKDGHDHLTDIKIESTNSNWVDEPLLVLRPHHSAHDVVVSSSPNTLDEMSLPSNFDDLGLGFIDKDSASTSTDSRKSKTSCDHVGVCKAFLCWLHRRLRQRLQTSSSGASSSISPLRLSTSSSSTSVNLFTSVDSSSSGRLLRGCSHDSKKTRPPVSSLLNCEEIGVTPLASTSHACAVTNGEEAPYIEKRTRFSLLEFSSNQAGPDDSASECMDRLSIAAAVSDRASSIRSDDHTDDLELFAPTLDIAEEIPESSFSSSSSSAHPSSHVDDDDDDDDEDDVADRDGNVDDELFDRRPPARSSDNLGYSVGAGIQRISSIHRQCHCRKHNSCFSHSQDRLFPPNSNRLPNESMWTPSSRIRSYLLQEHSSTNSDLTDPAPRLGRSHSATSLMTFHLNTTYPGEAGNYPCGVFRRISVPSPPKLRVQGNIDGIVSDTAAPGNAAWRVSEPSSSSLPHQQLQSLFTFHQQQTPDRLNLGGSSLVLSGRPPSFASGGTDSRDEEDDALSDQPSFSVNLSGRVSPSMTSGGRVSPLSTVSGVSRNFPMAAVCVRPAQGGGIFSNLSNIPLSSTSSYFTVESAAANLLRRVNEESDVTERFGKFDLPQQARSNEHETWSLASEAWSTDVLASDSESAHRSFSNVTPGNASSGPSVSYATRTIANGTPTNGLPRRGLLLSRRRQNRSHHHQRNHGHRQRQQQYYNLGRHYLSHSQAMEDSSLPSVTRGIPDTASVLDAITSSARTNLPSTSSSFHVASKGQINTARDVDSATLNILTCSRELPTSTVISNPCSLIVACDLQVIPRSSRTLAEVGDRKISPSPTTSLYRRSDGLRSLSADSSETSDPNHYRRSPACRYQRLIAMVTRRLICLLRSNFVSDVVASLQHQIRSPLFASVPRLDHPSVNKEDRMLLNFLIVFRERSLNNQNFVLARKAEEAESALQVLLNEYANIINPGSIIVSPPDSDPSSATVEFVCAECGNKKSATNSFISAAAEPPVDACGECASTNMSLSAWILLRVQQRVRYDGQLVVWLRSVRGEFARRRREAENLRESSSRQLAVYQHCVIVDLLAKFLSEESLLVTSFRRSIETEFLKINGELGSPKSKLLFSRVSLYLANFLQNFRLRISGRAHCVGEQLLADSLITLESTIMHDLFVLFQSSFTEFLERENAHLFEGIARIRPSRSETLRSLPNTYILLAPFTSAQLEVYVLNTVATPREKMLCLKRLVEKLSPNVHQILSAPETDAHLVNLIVFIIIETHSNVLLANLYFIENFGTQELLNGDEFRHVWRHLCSAMTHFGVFIKGSQSFADASDGHAQT